MIKYLVLSLYITSKRVLKKEEQRNPQVNNLRGRGDASNDEQVISIFLKYFGENEPSVRSLGKANLYAKTIR